MTNEKLLEQIRRDWKIASAAWGKQRDRENDDLRFQIPEEQWDADARKAREGHIENGVPIPARPMLSISRLAQPIQLVLNQERAAHLGVSIQPLSADADPETAAVLEGIYRRIERDSQAHIARSWAFSRGVKCGFGAYRVNTKYEDYTDDPFDQCITIERILHQEAVYFDPSATKPDFSDGNYAFVAQWMSVKDFKVKFPNADISGSDENGLSEMFTEEPDWVKGGGEDAAIAVAEYWWKEKRNEEITSPDKKQKRQKEVVTVKRALVCGWEVLEEPAEWNGRFIPLVPMVGQEIHPYDKERRWTGVITDAKDSQRMYNAAASNAVEMGALEPKAPWIGYAEQFEGYESEWQQSNTRSFPVLRHKMVRDQGGQLLPPPQRTQIDGGKLSISLQLLQMADQGIQATTATYDPSLGRTNSKEKSGKAIMALQQQGEEGNSHFMHNLADISMNYEARVILDLIPAIYDRPGRIARTLSEEDKAETVMLNAPFVQGPDGRPMAAPEQMPMGGNGQPRSMPPPGMMAQPPGQPMPMQPKPKTYDLRKGIYSVAISIGKTRQSALQEGAEEIGQMLQSMPNLGPVIMPTYLRFRDFPGAKELGELLAKVRDAQMPFLAETKEGEKPTEEQLASKVQAQQAQLEQMGKQIEAMGKALETKQVEQQGMLQKAQMDNQTKLQIASEKNDTELNLAAIQAQLKEVLEAIKMGHESKEAEADREQEALITAAKLPPPDLTWKGASDVPVTDPLGGKEI